jgi:hypothetical protein
MKETLKMYCVTNGYIGNGDVRAYCVARDEEHAKELAEIEYKKESCDWNGSGRYADSYWKSLKITLLCDDVSNGFCGEVSD